MKSFDEAFAEVKALLSLRPEELEQMRLDLLELVKDRPSEEILREIRQALAGGILPGIILKFLKVGYPYKPGLLRRATGSTGKALPDGGARAVIAAALGGVLTFVQVEFDLLSAAGVAALVPVVLGVSFVLAGIWDRYVKPRLR